MNPIETGSVDIDGAAIVWRSFGKSDRPTVIFAHSLGLDSSMWQPQVEEITDVHRVLVVDTRGHGDSGLGPGDFTIAELAQDLLTAADDARVERFHLCGISLAGLTGLWIAINHPQRLLTLTVANTAARIGSNQSWSERIAAVTEGGLKSISEASMGRFFSPDFGLREPERLAAIRAIFESCDPGAYLACCQVLAVTDLTDEIPQIQVPTLVIGAELDQSTTASQARHLNHAIAGSELVILERAAHLSNLDRAEQFTTVLKDFLSR